ncbi:uncharacterized protein TNIN_320961 [Trichonephila inaurata madagascariensis]|uniref:Uncharacterized protein n=1 Tax=Trichonephila inaurata madagascariensis TaxID=2747483 RepID=A0A8X6WXP4_9ARAC|nr:uncharacterized protein TNIN_320961 [Trichonephila inaurata madagascariensis]
MEHVTAPVPPGRRTRTEKGERRLDPKGAFQIRCLEEELRKAHSKLKRLLNEAERQRRRRERLRTEPKSLQPPRDEGIMTALKSCTRFQDFVRELNTLGFSLTHHDEDTCEGETMPEVDGVKVQVELIEGDEELSPDFKGDFSSNSDDPVISGSSSRAEEEGERYNEESYRQWFERQTEMQHRWEENFMREQMEMARTLLESVTTTFLAGVQQVISNLTTGRRFPPFCPDPPS